MRRALNALTPAERTAFVMRHWGGSGIEEIAEALKSSTSAAKNTVFRSVQKLRRALEPFVERRGQAKAMGTEL
jgi:RNA polymerase sigma-70 factor (ECF subfamily)